MKTAAQSLILAGTLLAMAGPALAEAGKAPAYELKQRSSFHTEDDARIPFWPIGFQRPKFKGDGSSAAVVKVSKIKLEPENFSVTSILLGNPALATINGRSFEEGEMLPVIYDTERLRVVVRAIRDGGVTLEYEDQQIVVPMKRPVLGQKQSDKKSEPVEFMIKLGSAKEKK